MKFVIKDEIRGRMRVRVKQNEMTCREADILQYYFDGQKCVTKVKVNERVNDVVICYSGSRSHVIKLLQQFNYKNVDVPQTYLDNSGRELNNYYKEKLINRVVLRVGNKLFVPFPIRAGITIVRSFKYIWEGIRTLAKGKIEVPVLDATAIGVSILRNDTATAGSIMFLLGIGEILEEWTHKKSVDDLARSMSLNIGKVWLVKDGQEILVPSDEIEAGDNVRIRVGNVIPFDGEVVSGEAMVNQASMTGESMPVRKGESAIVYAGTVVEEGEITISVRSTNGGSKYENIVHMIEESEKLKSSVESKASHLADQLVPYSLAGTALTYLFTRNVTKALSILMVDYSCALKLSMPLSVLSAINEAGTYSATVKGGKYMEAIAEADTIVFDKTGTLTKAEPTVKQVVSFNGLGEDELLRIAACLEEHFPHSMAKAVVGAARNKNLVHEEMHSKVEYIVAHGISSQIEGRKVIIGSYHFVFEDEKCIIPDDKKELFDGLPDEYSRLYMAIENELAAVICIEDPIREEAADIIKKLKEAGIKKAVMMTGDSERTAKAVAAKIGVDEYYSEVLPEDKAKFVEKEKSLGHKVIMVGDGINDSPALSAADVGIAISDGAELAREIADVTVEGNDLYELVALKHISNALMKRIHKNYRMIMGINSTLIVLGVAGIIPPTTSALLHNTSTIAISLKSLEKLI